MGSTSCTGPVPPPRSKEATCGCGYGYYANDGEGDWVPGWKVRTGVAPPRPAQKPVKVERKAQNEEEQEKLQCECYSNYVQPTLGGLQVWLGQKCEIV